MGNSNIYFVYILLDPRKPVLQPFYVGKGKGNRDTYHLSPRASRIDRNAIKNGVIGKIRSCGLQPVVFRYAKNLTENQAYALEKSLVSRFGRRNIQSGILTNLTDGGDGLSGYRFPEERKVEYSLRFSGENNPMFGRVRTSDERAKISATRKQRSADGIIKPTVHGEEHKQRMRKIAIKNGLGSPKRRILQIHPESGVTRIFESTTDFARIMGWQSSSNVKLLVSAGCLPRDGFFYRYEDAEDIKDGKIENASAMCLARESTRSNSAKKVGAFRNGIQELTYPSVRDVAEHHGVSYHKIWKVIKNEQEFDDLRWRYI